MIVFKKRGGWSLSHFVKEDHVLASQFVSSPSDFVLVAGWIDIVWLKEVVNSQGRLCVG